MIIPTPGIDQPQRSYEASNRRQLLAEAQRLRRRADDLERAAGREEPFDTAAFFAVLHGDWTAIRNAADSSADAGDRSLRVADSHLTRAIAAALLGDARTARATAARIEVADDDPAAARGARFARAVAHLVSGDAATATDLLVDLADRRPDRGVFAGVGLLAESAFRSGRPESALRLLDDGLDAAHPGTHEELAVAHAFVAHLDEVEDAAPLRSAFGRGRVELAVGMRRRRARDDAGAHPHLAAAVDHFRALGAASWTTVALNELRASGRRVPRTDDSLTDQQLAIARLAAHGLTNRQIGERLYLSPRTVGTHLYRAFPKLGITSRHQLPSALVRRATA